MSRTRWMATSVVAALGVAAGTTVADAASTTTVRATLTGKAERGSKGDPDGKGTAKVTVKGSQVCFVLTYTKVGALKGGHIHKGGPKTVGPHAVDLFSGKAKHSGCVTAKPAVAKDIATHPARYYVNLHDAAYPDGAIRGQLK